MSFFDVASTVISGVLSGGATGLIGIALQTWGDIKRRQHDLEVLKQQHANTVELTKIESERDLRTATLNAESAEVLAQIQANSKAEEMASADYNSSVKNDTATYLSPTAQKKWYIVLMMATVDFFRGIIRPGITIYCMVLLTMLLMWVHDMWVRAQLPLTPDDSKKLTMEIIGTTTYLVVTTTVWWFGRRPEAPPKR